MMKLNIFIKNLLKNFEYHKIDYCILRNYSTLPEKLPKGDIDFLVNKIDLKKINSVINNFDEVQIINKTKRNYVHNYFICEIDKGGNSSALQIDFIFDFIYQGVNLLNVKKIIQNSRIDKGGFKISDNYDDNLIKFLNYFLVKQRINPKYSREIVEAFQQNPVKFTNSFKSFGLSEDQIVDFYNQIIEFKDLKKENYSALIRANILSRKKNEFRNVFFHYFWELILRIPFSNSRISFVKLNPKNKLKILKALDSYSKEIVCIYFFNLIHYFKLFKIRSNSTLFIIYFKDSNYSMKDSLRNINVSLKGGMKWLK